MCESLQTLFGIDPQSTDLSIYFQTTVIALNGVDTVSTVRVEIWKVIIFNFSVIFHTSVLYIGISIFIFSFFTPLHT